MDITDHDINLLVPNYELCLKLNETGLFVNSKLSVKKEDNDIYYFDRENQDNICAPMLCEILEILFEISGRNNIHLDMMMFGTKCNTIKLDTFNPYFFQDKNIHTYFNGKGTFFESICNVLLTTFEELK